MKTTKKDIIAKIKLLSEITNKDYQLYECSSGFKVVIIGLNDSLTSGQFTTRKQLKLTELSLYLDGILIALNESYKNQTEF